MIVIGRARTNTPHIIAADAINLPSAVAGTASSKRVKVIFPAKTMKYTAILDISFLCLKVVIVANPSALISLKTTI